MSAAPPDMVEIFKSRDALHEVRNHLMETFALLPEQFAKLSLLTLAPLVEAEKRADSLYTPSPKKTRLVSMRAGIM